MLWVNAAGKIVRRVNSIIECELCPCCPSAVSVVLSGFSGLSCHLISETNSAIVDIVSGVNGGPFDVSVGQFDWDAATTIGTRRERNYANTTCGGSPYDDFTTNVNLYAQCDPLVWPKNVLLLVDIAGIGQAGLWELDAVDIPGTMNLVTCFNRLTCGSVTIDFQ